jgi:transcriptional regulator with XRE-family HTH domain
MLNKRSKYPKIAKAFKGLRIELDTWGKECTQGELAKKIDIMKPQISELENGKREPSIRELKAYSSYFNVPMEYLLGLKPNRHYENVDIGDKLGLSDDAIDILKAWHKTETGFNFVVDIILTYQRVCGGYGILYLLDEFFSSDAKQFWFANPNNKGVSKTKVVTVASDNKYDHRQLTVEQVEPIILMNLQDELKKLKGYLQDREIFPRKSNTEADFKVKEGCKNGKHSTTEK